MSSDLSMQEALSKRYGVYKKGWLRRAVLPPHLRRTSAHLSSGWLQNALRGKAPMEVSKGAKATELNLILYKRGGERNYGGESSKGRD